MLRIKGKILISLIILVVMSILGYLTFQNVLLAIETPVVPFILFLSIVMGLFSLLMETLAGLGLWTIWKEVPTLTKKNELQLASWLTEHNYVRCKNVKLVRMVSIEYSLAENDTLSKEKEVGRGARVIVTEDGVKYEFTPASESKIPLLDNYEYSIQEQGFMILTFKYEKSRMQVFRQHLG